MEIVNNIFVDLWGVYISGIVFMLLIIGYFFNIKLKPKFVVPFSRIYKGKYYVENVLIGLIILCLLLIPLNISYLKGKKVETNDSANVQILFDVSLSMVLDDIGESRISFGKKALTYFVKNLEGFNTSIIMYSGIPIIWSPFSDDTKAIISKVKKFDLSQFPPTRDFVGTAAGDAVYLGIDNLRKYSGKKKNPGSMILFTDGDTNIGSEPIQAAKYAKKHDITIYGIGIGKSGKVLGYDKYGTPVDANFSFEKLKNLVEKTGGSAYKLTDKKDFDNYFDSIINQIQQEQEKNIVKEYGYINNFIYPLISILLTIHLVIRLILIRV